MVDDLFAVPLDRFVKRRDELARELAESGDTEEAKRVKSLRKPTLPAWALNQVAHDQPKLVETLVSIHEKIRSASSAAEMRAATEERMAAIQHIVDAAEDVSDAVRKKMRSTLLAVATDGSAEVALREGRLEREMEPSGLGGFDLGLEVAPSAAAAPKAASDKPAESSRARKARERAARLEREAKEAAEEARSLRKAADHAERLAAAAERRAEEKKRKADEAERSVKS